ncbi:MULTISPECIES: hypothetical protein [unclassified Streptomyces]|uniref:hypothetical protein n=1 Tax=unclassified Streptomyces TaxID=2593676 RepID=UPI003802579F
MDRPSPVQPRDDCPSGLLYAVRRTDGPRCRAPIYARLVAEWRARGRTVPARPDVRAAPPASTRRTGRDEDGTSGP